MVPVRLRASALEAVDTIAAEQDSSRSEVLRRLLRLGLIAWQAGKR